MNCKTKKFQMKTSPIGDCCLQVVAKCFFLLGIWASTLGCLPSAGLGNEGLVREPGSMQNAVLQSMCLSSWT
jgi:hypothetical protein